MELLTVIIITGIGLLGYWIYRNNLSPVGTTSLTVMNNINNLRSAN